MCVFRVTCVSGSAPGLIDSWSNPVLHHYFPSKQHVDSQHLLRSVRWICVLPLMHWWCFLKPRSRAWSWGCSSCMCCTHVGSCMGSCTLNPAKTPELRAVSHLTWPANLDCRWDPHVRLLYVCFYNLSDKQCVWKHWEQAYAGLKH